MTTTMTCAECRYFCPFAGPGNEMRGGCRRHAPRPMLVNDDWCFPSIHATDWCGEFAAKGAPNQTAAPWLRR